MSTPSKRPLASSTSNYNIENTPPRKVGKFRAVAYTTEEIEVEVQDSSFEVEESIRTSPTTSLKLKDYSLIDSKGATKKIKQIENKKIRLIAKDSIQEFHELFSNFKTSLEISNTNNEKLNLKVEELNLKLNNYDERINFLEEDNKILKEDNKILKEEIKIHKNFFGQNSLPMLIYGIASHLHLHYLSLNPSTSNSSTSLKTVNPSVTDLKKSISNLSLIKASKFDPALCKKFLLLLENSLPDRNQFAHPELTFIQEQINFISSGFSTDPSSDMYNNLKLLEKIGELLNK